jgi:hypothetical protein
MNLLETAKLHDELYEKGVEILEKYGNPCQENFGKILRPKSLDIKGIVCPCCEGCEYLGDSGCTTQSLLCKLWVCQYIRDEYPEMWKELKELLLKAYDTELIIMRGSKKDLLRRKIVRNLGKKCGYILSETRTMIEKSYHMAIDLLI